MKNDVRRPAAVELLDTLYPIGEAPALTTRTREQRFTAVPSIRSARLIVSTASTRASAVAIRRQLNGQRRRTRLARGIVSAAARTGALRLLPRSTLTVAPAPASDFTSELTRRLGSGKVHLTMPIGPDRANRKPIVQVSDVTGRPLAFVKVGHNPLTRALVESEATSLRDLVAADHVGIAIPESLFTFEWHDSRVLAITPLAIPVNRLAGRAARTRLVDLVREVSSLSAPPTTSTWPEHPLRRRLLRSFADLGRQGEPFAAAVADLDDPTPLDTGGWHGDLNSGNLALVSGPCPVWDWERYESSEIPVGFDLLHHDLHQWITVDGMAPRIAARRLVSTSAVLLAGLVPSERCDLVARGYLLTLAERYLRDNQESAGAPLGAVEEWLLPALTTAAGAGGAR